MKQLFMNRHLVTGFNKTLCRPLGYAEMQEIVCTKEFPANGYTIALRPFCLNTDFSFAYEWMRRTYAPRVWQTNSAVKQLEETYSLMLQSDFAQPFVVLVNSVPVCLADVYMGRNHELSLYINNIKEDDFVVQLLMGPRKKKEQTLTTCILQTCQHYFFSFPEVKRLISEPNIWDKDLNDAMVQTGFRFLQKTDMVYKTANVYECLREG